MVQIQNIYIRYSNIKKCDVLEKGPDIKVLIFRKNLDLVQQVL